MNGIFTSCFIENSKKTRVILNEILYTHFSDILNVLSVSNESNYQVLTRTL